MQIRYRKTKDGEWVAYGPASAVKAHDEVVIGKADGSADCRYVERVGRPFTVNGVRMVYGYLEPRTSRSDRQAASLRRTSQDEDWGIYA